MPSGGNRKNAGRKKGSLNKTTIEFKEAVINLMNHAAPQMVGWLEKVAQDNPKDALEMVNKLGEYGFGKISRIENRYVDEKGKDLSKKDLQIIENYNNKLLKGEK